MRKVVFIAGLLQFAYLNAADNAQLKVKASVGATLSLERRGGGDIDLFGANNTASFVGRSNSSQSVVVTVHSDNGLKVKEGTKEIPYTIKHDGENVTNDGTFNAPSDEQFSLVFASTKTKNECKAGHYEDTVTVTVAAVEGAVAAAGSPLLQDEGNDDDDFNQGGEAPQDDSSF